MRTAILAALALLAAGCGRGELKEYTPDDKSFTVLLYADTKSSSRQADGATVRLIGNLHPDGAMAVAYVEMEAPGAVEARIDQARDALLKNTGAKLKGDKKALVAGTIPARLIDAELPDEKGRLRVMVFFTGGRRYQLQVIGTAAYVDSENAERFLDSFVPGP